MKSVIVTKDKVREVILSINKLVAKSVLVGIPDTTTDRDPDEQNSGPMNNATLGYIHEYGSPKANIPARPFLIPGVKASESKYTAKLKKAAEAALNGQRNQIDAQLDAAGLIAQNSVKSKINSGDFVPLADATLEARIRRKQGSGVRVNKGAEMELAARRAGAMPSTQFAKPLIDTGQLRNSITYVIRGKT